MKSLDHKQIFLDVLRGFFAPLVGAVRGSLREVARVERQIQRRRRLEVARPRR